MDNLRGVLDYIRSFFSPTFVEPSRKRRAIDPLEHIILSPPKTRRIHIDMPRVLNDDGWIHTRNNPRRTSILKTSPRNSIRANRQHDTVILDDDDEILEIKSVDKNCFKEPKLSKFTSTPENQPQRSYTNGINEEDDITFIREIKSPKEKQKEASKRGLNYIKPLSGLLLNGNAPQNGTKPKERSKVFSGISKKNLARPSFGSSSLDYSFRLDDKIRYKQLLESFSSPDSSSIYQTPIGKMFNNLDSASRSTRILRMSLKKSPRSPVNSNTSNERLSTKDTIKKILDNFETEPVAVKDSDSDSDVIIVNPPSPKPDIKVDPVNSFKKVVDTSQQTKSDWLDELVERHRSSVDKRQKEIEELRECSEKHSKINNDLRWELLTNKINRSLTIKDVILPEQEKEVELPELTAAQLKQVEHAFRGDPSEVLSRKFNLNITRRDLQTLAGLNWLNDEVINFYMNLIIERGKDSKWPKTYAFNTFFYLRLSKDGPQSIRRWTKRVDLFQHDLICVPIHLGMHWCMAVIDLRDRCIRYYDSMGSSNTRCLEHLRNYLEAEHMDKKKKSYDTSDFILENVKDIPQQMNGSDCGMFACTFAEFLSRNAKITFSQENMPYLRKKMVVEILNGELLIK